MEEKTGADVCEPTYIADIACGESPELQNEYERWLTVLDRDVEFGNKRSVKHTSDHCARVLLFALKMAHMRGIDAARRDTLGAAAVFHDSRRLDDWYDVGHGGRAASYYKEFCEQRDIPVDEQSALIMAYHDQDDALGEKKIGEAAGPEAVELYKVFKDADALDRFRLCEGAFDPKYMRTEEGRGLIAFAEDLVRRTGGALPHPAG